jgi:uncharacterized membrane protein YoaK (UPF0700 family)
MADVDRSWGDVVLVLCYLITGLLDSASISIWGSFVSMQTGNTVYIGLGLAAPSESTRWIKSGTSLGCFCVGSFLFSRFHRFVGQRRRITLIASFAFQTVLIMAAAAMVTFGPEGGGKNDIAWNVLVPIALVAFQSCGQAVTSRALKYNALTSVVLTSIYCDLFSDTQLFHLHNVERNQRLGAPIMLLMGAIAGGKFAHSSFGIAGALWTAAGLKLLVVIAWFFWPAEEEEEE